MSHLYDDGAPLRGGQSADTLAVAPLVQLGVWQCFKDILLGAKLYYNYFDSSRNTGGGTSSFNTIPHNVALMLNVGTTWRKIHPYAGVGAFAILGFRNRYTTGSDQQAPNSTNWVGVQIGLGFLYNLTQHWFFDANYTLGANNRKTFSGVTDNGSEFVTRKVRILLQNVMISVNRRF